MFLTSLIHDAKKKTAVGAFEQPTAVWVIPFPTIRYNKKGRGLVRPRPVCYVNSPVEGRTTPFIATIESIT